MIRLKLFCFYFGGQFPPFMVRLVTVCMFYSMKIIKEECQCNPSLIIVMDQYYEILIISDYDFVRIITYRQYERN